MMSENEAIAGDAWEAGLNLCCADQGTPSSEILAEVANYKEIFTEW